MLWLSSGPLVVPTFDQFVSLSNFVSSTAGQSVRRSLGLSHADSSLSVNANPRPHPGLCVAWCCAGGLLASPLLNSGQGRRFTNLLFLGRCCCKPDPVELPA